MSNLRILSYLHASQLQAAAVENNSAIQITLTPYDLGFEVYGQAAVNMPADQVIQQYQSDDCFNFKKFVEDHHPWTFSGTRSLENEVLDTEINGLIESEIKDAYDNILFLKKIGFNPDIVNTMLGNEADEQIKVLDNFDAVQLLEPMFAAAYLDQGHMHVNVVKHKILDSNLIEVEFNIHPISEIPDHANYFEINSAVIFKVDHAEKKLTIQSVKYKFIQVYEYDEEEQDHYMIDLDDWFFGFNQIEADIPIYDTAKMDEFMTRIIESDVTLKKLAEQVFA